jgi:hypothetical protein
MNVREVCMSLLEFSERYFRLIESSVPPPQWVPWDNRYNWRYVEQLPSQILVQKLARQITGLKAVDVLILKGLLQEVGVMFRVLDEISEDVSFISLAISNNDWTKNHRQYAEYFWSENEDDLQPTVQRKKIRAYINRIFDQPDPSSADAVGRTLHRAFSDYIHARSAPTMGMVSGPPALFHLDGITEGQTRQQYVDQISSYYYRSAMSIAMAARATLPDNENTACYNEFSEFEHRHRSMLFPSG